MGRNLLYNIADNGFSVAGFDLDAEKARELEQGATQNTVVRNSFGGFCICIGNTKKNYSNGSCG
jgi:6-phosphogluconate dehydrogenase